MRDVSEASVSLRMTRYQSMSLHPGTLELTKAPRKTIQACRRVKMMALSASGRADVAHVKFQLREERVLRQASFDKLMTNGVGFHCMPLSSSDLARYSRHLALREIGVSGQEKLKAAKVLVVGAGGLGSPSILYLAAAGVGTIGIVDFDKVDISNLQRQILFDSVAVGAPKAEAAGERLRELN